MTGLICLADLQQIKLISAKVVSAKVNKTAKAPAYLCSLDVGEPLLEVQLHLRLSMFVALVPTQAAVQRIL